VAQDIINRRGAAVGEAAVAELRAMVGGEVLRPGDGGYDAARRIWNGMIDRHPSLIVRCAGAADAIHAVRFARANDLALSVRGGGHSPSGNAVCEGGVVVDLSRMRGVRVDPVARTARAEGGAMLRDLDRECQVFGLATPAGTVSDTGIAGLTLGGGVGWLRGIYGASVDNLLSVDIITADGSFLTAGADQHQDLFWAVRGAGANFGVVTSFEYRLHPVGPIVVGGLIFFPIDRAHDVLRFYRDFTAAAPDVLTVYAALLTAPEGVPVVALGACYAGPVAEGEAAIAPLRTPATPIADHLGPLPYVAQQQLLDAAFPTGRLYYEKGGYLSGLSDDAIDTFIEHFARVPSPFSAAVIEHNHGAITRVAPDAMAFPQRGSPYNLVIIAGWEEPAASEVNIAWARGLFGAMQPYASGGVYVNSLGSDDQDRVRAAYGPNHDHLAALKARYDPTNFFGHNANIKPAS
jgi:FAD/FMN-containing dehydrogenase